MLKIILSTSEIKKYFKQCQVKKIPCVTIKFHETNASIRCNFDSTGVELSPEQWDLMKKEWKIAVEQHRPFVKTDLSSGRYPLFKIHASVAYKLALELARIMCKHASVDLPDFGSKYNYPIAPVIKITNSQCTILCPYCGKLHYHSSVPIDGHVSSHCLVKSPDDRGYLIELNT